VATLAVVGILCVETHLPCQSINPASGPVAEVDPLLFAERLPFRVSEMEDLEMELIPPSLDGTNILFPETHVLSTESVQAGTAKTDSTVQSLSMSGTNQNVFFRNANRTFLDGKNRWEFSLSDGENLAAPVNASATACTR
jgi:hypothetical protein